MQSYLSNEIKILDNGIQLLRMNGQFLSWDYFYSKNNYCHLHERHLTFLDNSTVTFYLLDIISPENEILYRINFPEGKEQRDSFQTLLVYYILKHLKALDLLDSSNKESDNFIQKLFRN